MRVVFMCHLFPNAHNAGGEWMALELLAALADRGHDVRVLLSRSHQDITDPYEIRGVQVHPYRHRSDPWQHVTGAALLLTHLENTPRAVALSRVTGVPLGLIIHNTRPWTRSWLVPEAALVVFNSRWVAAELGGHPRGIVVRPPVRAEQYRTAPGDRVTLINLNEEKGAGLFWDLARRMPDVPFLGVRGAYGRQVVGTLPNVEIVDHVPGDQMAERVYARTRVLLMPSAYESWGRTAIEAAASGIPTVAHPTPGLVESLDFAGIFADRSDLDAWERELRDLQDDAAWGAASVLARGRSNELDPTADIERFVAAVERVARRRPIAA